MDGSTTGFAANAFVSERNETLGSVMICTTGWNAAYQVDVYRNLADPANPRSGELVSTQSGAEEKPGYHMIALDRAVELAAGDSFSVVVGLQNASYTHPIAVETFSPDPELPDAQPTYMGHDASGQPEVSWVSSDGSTWTNPAGYGHDLAGSNRSAITNVCVKALTLPRTNSGSGDATNNQPDSGKALVKTSDGMLPAALLALSAAALAVIAVSILGAASNRRKQGRSK